MEEQDFSLNTQTSTAPIGELQPPHKLEHLLIGAIALGVLVAGAVFGFGYLSEQKESPQEIVAAAFKNLSEVDSYSYAGEIIATLPNRESSFLGFSLSSLGKTPRVFAAESDKPTARFVFEGSIGGLRGGEPNGIFTGRVILPGEQGNPISLTINFRQVGGITYVQFANLPPAGIFGVLKFIENQWISIDQQAILSQLGIDPETIAESQQETELNREKILALFALYNPITVSQSFSKEEIGGRETYRYRYHIDKERLIQLFVALDQAAAIGPSEIAPDAAANLRNILEKVEFQEADIFIGVEDKFLYKFTAGLRWLDNDQNVRLSLSFGSYNQPLVVEAPESSLPLEEIIGMIFGASLNLDGFEVLGYEEYRSGTRDTRRVTDIRLIALALENYYDANKTYPPSLSALIPDYLKSIPVDPSDGSNYVYGTTACKPAAQRYVVGKKLENIDTPALAADADGVICGINCNDPVYCIAP